MYHFPVVVNNAKWRFQAKQHDDIELLITTFRRITWKIPSTSTVNPTTLAGLSLEELLERPIYPETEYGLIDETQDLNLEINHSFVHSYCRLALAFSHFLRSSVPFSRITSRDRIKLVQHNFVAFIILIHGYAKWNNSISSEQWFKYRGRFKLTGRTAELQALYEKRVFEFIENFLEPTFNELGLDETELVLIVITTIFSSSPELSDFAQKQVSFARDAYSLRLVDHFVQRFTTVPPLSYCFRLRSILESIRRVNDTLIGYSPFFVQAVMDNYGGMNNNLPYDLHIRRY